MKSDDWTHMTLTKFSFFFEKGESYYKRKVKFSYTVCNTKKNKEGTFDEETLVEKKYAPNVFLYDKESIPVFVEVRDISDRKKYFKMMIRFHLNLRKYLVHDNFNEFGLHRHGSASYLLSFQELIQSEFFRRFPDHYFFIEKTQFAGKTLEVARFFLHFIPVSFSLSNYLLLVVEGKGVSVRTKERVGGQKLFNQYRKAGAVEKLWSSIRFFLPDTFFKSLLKVLYLYHTDKKLFSTESDLLVQQMEKGLIGTRGNVNDQKPYKVIGNYKVKLNQQLRLLLGEVGRHMLTDESNPIHSKLGDFGPNDLKGLVGKIISEALVNEDYDLAFKYVVSGCTFKDWEHLIHGEQTGMIFLSRFYSSVLSKLSIVKKNEQEFGIYDDYYRSEYIEQIVQVINQKSSPSPKGEGPEEKVEFAEFSIEYFFKKCKGETSRSEDHIRSSSIPYIFELCYIYLLQGDETEAFEIIYDIVINRSLDITCSTYEQFDFIIQKPTTRIAHGCSNALCISRDERNRTYNILIHHILRKRFDQFVHFVNTKEKTSSSSSSGYVFHMFGLLLRHRGEFELALEYLNLAKESSTCLKSNLAHSISLFEVFMELDLFDQAWKEAYWIFILSKKVLLHQEEEDAQTQNDFSEKKFDEILAILSPSSTSESFTTRSKFYDCFLRIPCFFQKDFWVVVGWEIEKNEILQSKNYSSIIKKYLNEIEQTSEKTEAFELFDSEHHEKLVKKIFSVIYDLPIISYLQKDFVSLRKWILCLSDFEIYPTSYHEISNHHTFQIISNSFFLQFLSSTSKKKKRNNSYDEHCLFLKKRKRRAKNKIRKRKIYVIGSDDVLPWSFQEIQLSDDHVYEIIPLYIKDIKCSDLFVGNQVTNDLKKRMMLLDKISSRSNFDKKNSIFMFMMGEMDLRARISDLPTLDNLHFHFCESQQVELLADILLRFAFSCKREFGLNHVAICPVFPTDNFSILEDFRVGNTIKLEGEEICANRVDLFNDYLRKKTSKNIGELKYLEGLGSRKFLNFEDNLWRSEFALGYGNYVRPSEKMLEKLKLVLEEKFMFLKN